MSELELVGRQFTDAALPLRKADAFRGYESQCPVCDQLCYIVAEDDGSVRVLCELGCSTEDRLWWLRRLAAGEEELSGNGSEPEQPEPLSATDEGAMVLRAVLGALPVDVRAATLDPFDPLPGAPFLVPGATAQLAGPEGSGKSQVAQIIAYDVALAGGCALYLAGEVTLDEFRTRARDISEARDGELTDEAAKVWRERVAFADVGDALPAIWRHLDAWSVVCAEFSFIVLDAVSDAGAALGLKFARDNDDWGAFFQAFVKPCQGRVALLMLDNVGHGEDAKTRALGASAKGHKVDIRLSSKSRDRPLSLVITAEKVRPRRAPFRKGARWVAYEEGCKPAVPFDARQVELEQEQHAPPDPVAVVITALETHSPQGQIKLVKAMREAGVEGRDKALRERLKAMADDPECPVRDTGGRGLELAQVTPELPMAQAMSEGYVHGPYRGRAMDPPADMPGEGSGPASAIDDSAWEDSGGGQT